MRQKEILIIEDEESIRDILSYSLRKEGFEIKEAATGKEGLDLLRDSKPDLILLDLMLPQGEGDTGKAGSYK
nr:response regulator [Paenibacillus sp. PAMC 26794]